MSEQINLPSSIGRQVAEPLVTEKPARANASGELTVNVLLDAMESIQEGLAYYDADDRLVMANSQMAKCYPLLSDIFVVGTTFEEILRAGVERGQFGPANGAKEAWIQEVLAYHRDPKGAREFNLNDGRSVRVVERRTSDGGIVGVRADITEMRMAEAALEKSHDELERHVVELRASKSDFERQATEVAELAENQALLNERLCYEIDVKNKFFSIISHDLKSPFNSLLGLTHMMSQMADSFSKDKLVEFATNVNEAGNEVFALLQNLLEWARLQMEGAKLDLETVSLQEIVRENIRVLNPIALEKNISLKNGIGNMTAFADRNMVRTVVRNLIANALKFTPSGGSVEISSRRTESTVQVTVTDTGVGMSTEKSAKIFALDQKTSTTGTAGEKGTGLGLPLCKDMIERIGGRIWVESACGEGSQFHFTLPHEPGSE